MRNTSVSLKDFIDDLFEKHMDGLNKLTHNAQYKKDFGIAKTLPAERECPAFDTLVDPVANWLVVLLDDWPIINWEGYTAAAVMRPYISNIANATYADTPHVLPDTTLVQVTGLLPDAYLEYNTSLHRTRIKELLVTMADGTVENFADGWGRLLPLAFVSEGPDNHGWVMNEDIIGLSTMEVCPPKEKSKVCENPPFRPAKISKLELPKSPYLNSVASASGGFAGLVGSPTMFKHASMGFILDGFPWFLAIAKVIRERVDTCMPFGLQLMCPPVLEQGITTLANAELHPQFRYLDGGYHDNTAVAQTLATAQRDCLDRKRAKAKGIDFCGEGSDTPITLILVNDANYSSNTQGEGGKVNTTSMDHFISLFWNESMKPGSWVAGMWDLAYKPSSTVFAESPPTPDQWKEFNRFESTRTIKIGGHHPDFKKIKHNITSHVWTGELTTVDNKYYGIKAGTKVRLMCFSLDLPGLMWPGLFDATMAWDKPGQALLPVGKFNYPDQINGHGPFAEKMAVTMGPYVKDFLKDWINQS